jgi:hypothetical protein
MGQHVRGKLGPAGRVRLVRLMVDDGYSERAAAVALAVASATAHHWKHRSFRPAPRNGRPGVGRLTARAVRTAPRTAHRRMSSSVFAKNADVLVGDHG